MSTPDATAAERVSVPRILADLLMLGQLHHLPDPFALEATEGNGIASIDVRSKAAFDAWTAALGCNPNGYFSDQPYKTGRIASAPAVTRLGWHVTLAAQYEGEVHTELPVEQLLALDQIANPATVRAEEIRGKLNGFRSQIGDETDANLDLAVGWAREQPDVVGIRNDGPDFPEVHLADGTVIAYDPDAELWEFAAGTGS